MKCSQVTTIPFGGAESIAGVGTRFMPGYAAAIFSEKPDISWWEAAAETYLPTRGAPLHLLEQLRRDYPISLHSSSLSLGSSDPLNYDLLRQLRELCRRVEPALLSDHLSWSSIDGRWFHQQLPLPFTDETSAHLAQRISAVQDFLGRRLLIENISPSVRYNESEMNEPTFLCEVARRSDCYIMLNISSLITSCCASETDPNEYLSALPADRVREICLSSQQSNSTESALACTETAPIYNDTCLNIYQRALMRFGPVPTLAAAPKGDPLESILKSVEGARDLMRKSNDIAC